VSVELPKAAALMTDAGEGERCERCGWPLAESPADGCVPGNCSERPLPPVRGPEPRWRVGRTVGRTLYVDDRIVGMVDTPEMATTIVAAMNGEGCGVCAECNRQHETSKAEGAAEERAAIAADLAGHAELFEPGCSERLAFRAVATELRDGEFGRARERDGGAR